MIRRLALVLSFCLLVFAPAAQGAFPGGNGKIVYTTEPESGSRQLSLVDPSTLLSTPFVPDPSFSYEHSSWSSDGSRVLMSREDASSHFNIWVANADGSGLRQATFSNGDLDPAWAPDGHTIVYVGPDALYTVNIDNPADTPHKIPGTGVSAFSPAWSPDGALIAFENDSGSNHEIDVVAPDGSGLHAVATAPSSSFDEQPAWTPDGARIYYAQGANVLGCYSNPKFQIYSVSRTGAHPLRSAMTPRLPSTGPRRRRTAGRSPSRAVITRRMTWTTSTSRTSTAAAPTRSRAATTTTTSPTGSPRRHRSPHRRRSAAAT